MPRPDTKVYLSVKRYSHRACRCSSDNEGKGGHAKPVDHEYSKSLDMVVSPDWLQLGDFIVRSPSGSATPPPGPQQPSA